MSKKLLISAAMGAAMMLMLPGCSQPNPYVVYESASSAKSVQTCCELIQKYGCKGVDMGDCKRIAMSSSGPVGMSDCDKILRRCGVRLP